MNEAGERFYDEVLQKGTEPFHRVGWATDEQNYAPYEWMLFNFGRGRVLDVGCGIGAGYDVFGDHFDYSGVDTNRDAVKLAAATFPKGRFVVGNQNSQKVGNLKQAPDFDFVVAHGIFNAGYPDFSYVQKVLSDCYKRAGRAFVFTFIPFRGHGYLDMFSVFPSKYWLDAASELSEFHRFVHLGGGNALCEVRRIDPETM